MRERHPHILGTSRYRILERVDWTWRGLEQRVAALAEILRSHGVGVGDRVGAVLPNIPEAIVALLATASIGAIWTVSSPDLAPAATVERLRPLEPVVLIGTAGYGFKGKRIETLSALAEVAAELPTLRAVRSASLCSTTSRSASARQRPSRRT